MKYLIDDANVKHIEEVLSMGVYGITANPSMYAKNNISLINFLNHFKTNANTFLSGEVMQNSYDEMIEEAERLLMISPNIVIKICFSKEGLKLCNFLHKRGVKTAMTLIFSLSQCAAAINAGATYIFFFIGRNEEQGDDGLALIETAMRLCEKSKSNIIAASVKNKYHLNALCKMGIEYVAIPYRLYMDSLEHPLTNSGYQQFKKDWETIL